MQAYLHIPFCRQRCSYCRFALDPRPNTAKIAKYLAALKEEIQTYLSSHSNTPIETIYFGGGTPSVLSSKQLSLLLDLFPISQRAKDIEITIECNPEDITKSYANDLVSLGCTRVSLGVQTMNDIGLQIIGRSISTTTLHALEYLTHSGHRNINLDFILGLPDVKRGEILGAIRSLYEMYPESIQHTSIYFLEYEHTYPKDWVHRSLSREAQYLEYTEIVDYLVNQGFHHYEVSNFARPGYESCHNKGYWNHSEAIGFGLSAASYTEGQRYQNSVDFASYYRGQKSDEILSPEDIRIEKIMFGLRTFSLDPQLSTPAQIDIYLEKGLLKMQKGRLSPTLPGIFELDHIISGLI